MILYYFSVFNPLLTANSVFVRFEKVIVHL